MSAPLSVNHGLCSLEIALSLLEANSDEIGGAMLAQLEEFKRRFDTLVADARDTDAETTFSTFASEIEPDLAALDPILEGIRPAELVAKDDPPSSSESVKQPLNGRIGGAGCNIETSIADSAEVKPGPIGVDTATQDIGREEMGYQENLHAGHLPKEIFDRRRSAEYNSYHYFLATAFGIGPMAIIDDGYVEDSDPSVMNSFDDIGKIRRARFLIMPDSQFRVSWDLFIMLLILYYAVMTPVRVGFDLTLDEGAKQAERALWAFFLVDIFLNFVTAERMRGVLVTDKLSIAGVYLRSWLIIDIVAVIPFDEFTDAKGAGSSAKLTKLFRVMRIFKLLRLLKLSRIIGRIREYSSLNPNVMVLVKTVMGLFFTWHWAACIYWFIASNQDGREHCTDSEYVPPMGVEPNEAECSWTYPARITTHSFSFKYAYAIFWGISVTTGIGWDVVPYSPIEVYFSSAMIVTGTVMYVTIIGGVTSVVSDINSQQAAKRQQMENTFKYLRMKRVPVALERKIRRYYEYLWEYDIEVGKPVVQPMGDLPTTLQMEISNEVNRVLIDHSPLFKGISGHPEATFEITSNLHRRVYLPGDFIIRRETLPQELFMLLKGRVKVSDQSGRDLAVLDEPHTFFGENALLHKTRTADCIALEYCDVLVLSLATYDRISRKYPQMRKVMTQLLEQESETRAVAARKMWAKAMDMSKRATRVSIRQRVASALQRGSIRSVSNSLRPKSSSPKANQVNPADNSARVAFEGEADAANRANLPAFLGERIPT